MYKKGDRVRNKKTGEIDTVISVPGMREYDRCGLSSADKGFVLERNSWEFQDEWEPVQKQFIVHCPTEELWKRVQTKMFSEGYEWVDGGTGYYNGWNYYKERSCISIIESRDYDMAYDSKSYYEKEYPTIPIISASEYLGEETFSKGTNTRIQDFYVSEWMSKAYDELFKRINYPWYTINWDNPITNSPTREHKKPMNGLKKVTNFIDSLQEPLKSYIRLGWVELEEDKYYVTSDGKQADAEIKFGLVKHKTLEAYAEAEVKRLEKEEKKK